MARSSEPGPDAHVVGGGLQVLTQPRLDRAEEVVVGRLGFDDDGPALGVAIVHHDVDPVAQQRVALLAAIVGAEKLQVLQHVPQQLVEVLRDAGILDRPRNVGESLLQQRFHGGAAQLLGARNHLLAHHHDLVENALQLLGEPAVRLLEGGRLVPIELALFREALKLLEGHRPLLDQRQDLRPGDRPDLHLHQRETRRPDLALEPLDQLLLLGLEVLERELQALLELFPLEHARQRLGDVTEQPFQAVTEDDATPGGQAQESGLLGAGEVEDEEQVVGRLTLARERAQVELDGGHSAGTREAGYEDVEAQRLDGQAELEGAHGARLPDDPLRGLDLGCGLGRQPVFGAPPPQIVSSKLSRHRPPPHES